MACNILYLNTNDQRWSCVPATNGFAKKLCLLSTDSNVPEMFYKVNVKYSRKWYLPIARKHVSGMPLTRHLGSAVFNS